jgi:nitroreductase
LNIQEVIEKRRSIRKFKPQAITEEHLQILKIAIQLAPSASNMQPYKFIIVTDEELKKNLVKAGSLQEFLSKAAVIFVGIGDPSREKWFKVDIGIAMEHLALQATELGLGSCWIGAFDEEQVKAVLKISQNLRVVALMPIGIAGQDPPARPRKSLEELFIKNYYTTN